MTLAHLQILGTAGETTPSVLYFSDSVRLLFNCGEGTQRLCVEHKVRFAKLSTIFLTSTSWDCVGGLPGMLLTLLSATGKPALVHGPAGTRELMYDVVVDTKMQPFSREGGVGVGVDIDAAGSSANVIKFPDGLRLTPVIQSGTRVAEGCESAPKRPKRGPPADTISYVGRLADTRGKFDVKAAIALGVPKGAMFGRLQRGISVTLDDGTVVLPEQVMGPGQRGPAFAVVDCPTGDHLANLRSSPAFAELLALDAPVSIVHLGPAPVVDSSPYREWMESFPQGTTTHILVNEETARGSVTYRSATEQQALLHAVHPSTFPLPSIPLPPATRPEGSDAPARVVPGCLLLRHTLLPLARNKLSWADCPPPMDLAPIVERAAQLEGFADLAAEQALRISKQPASAALCSDDVQLTFLGTGSCLPAKYRNVTGMLLTLGSAPDAEAGATARPLRMLLDVGEGTFAQMFRLYGAEGIDEVLCSLRCVHVSHMHADHHLGLLGILRKREAVLAARGMKSPPVVVVAPAALERWLEAYCSIEHVPYSFVSAGCLVGSTADAAPDSYPPALAAFLDDAGLSLMQNVRVIHCPNAFGVVLQRGSSGWKMVWSGDTRPCANLIRAGKDATLLVHEATFDDELQEDARKKRHSTTAEAVSTGAAMGAKLTLLTHFSQRYPKIPVIDSKFEDTTAIAFDHMHVDFRTMHMLPHLLPLLKLVFAEEYSADAEDGGTKPLAVSW